LESLAVNGEAFFYSLLPKELRHNKKGAISAPFH